MTQQTFKALVVEETANGFTKTVQDRQIEELPAGEVLVRVHYSSLNYKDALSASGNKGVTQNYPHTPGIDASGVVVHSTVAAFAKGDKVIVTSYDLGMNTPGGFGEYIRVPAEWVVPLPSAMTLKEAMIYGTAGFTTAQMIDRLQLALDTQEGKVLVSGATGGVGSMAVAILHKLGYEVTALSGKAEAAEYLKSLGANSVLSRHDFANMKPRAMFKGEYIAGIDTVGGVVLENMIKSVKQYGAVSCCGNAGSHELNLNVFPFILRGVSLMGVSSQSCPMPKRLKLWQLLAEAWKPKGMESMYTTIQLPQLPTVIDEMLQGNIRGRFVVDMMA